MFFPGAANWTMEWYRPQRDSLDDIASNLATTFALALTIRASQVDLEGNLAMYAPNGGTLLSGRY